MKSAKKELMNTQMEDESELRRGPWTLEEDTLLSHYISRHGEGRWNMLAKCAGLKRTGKSCRLRWLNYLKPDIKRGNLTPQEQLLILELHSKWGNRWSKIAQCLPGRTDNEIKNYWRTRVQKHARQLNIESDSQKFLDAIKSYWMPRLAQKIEQNTTCSDTTTDYSQFVSNNGPPSINDNLQEQVMMNSPYVDMMNICDGKQEAEASASASASASTSTSTSGGVYNNGYSYNEYEMDVAYEGQVGGCDWLNGEFGDAFWNSDDIWHFRE